MPARTQILVRGVVQGVGFRPYVYSLAQRRALRGEVSNNGQGVIIDVEGEPEVIEGFIDELKVHPPPLSLIEAVEKRQGLAPANYNDFRIVASTVAKRGSCRLPSTPPPVPIA